VCQTKVIGVIQAALIPQKIMEILGNQADLTETTTWGFTPHRGGVKQKVDTT